MGVSKEYLLEVLDAAGAGGGGGGMRRQNTMLSGVMSIGSGKLKMKLSEPRLYNYQDTQELTSYALQSCLQHKKETALNVIIRYVLLW